MTDSDPRAHLLRACRSVLPDVAGVVLASPEGRVLAHEPHPDPARLAGLAVQQRPAGLATSQLVHEGGARFLVVFVPDRMAREWQAFSSAPELAAS